jgi:hypothetical protein
VIYVLGAALVIVIASVFIAFGGALAVIWYGAIFHDYD